LEIYEREKKNIHALLIIQILNSLSCKSITNKIWD